MSLQRQFTTRLLEWSHRHHAHRWWAVVSFGLVMGAVGLWAVWLANEAVSNESRTHLEAETRGAARRLQHELIHVMHHLEAEAQSAESQRAFESAGQRGEATPELSEQVTRHLRRALQRFDHVDLALWTNGQGLPREAVLRAYEGTMGMAPGQVNLLPEPVVAMLRQLQPGQLGMTELLPGVAAVASGKPWNPMIYVALRLPDVSPLWDEGVWLLGVTEEVLRQSLMPDLPNEVSLVLMDDKGQDMASYGDLGDMRQRLRDAMVSRAERVRAVPGQPMLDPDEHRPYVQRGEWTKVRLDWMDESLRMAPWMASGWTVWGRHYIPPSAWWNGQTLSVALPLALITAVLMLIFGGLVSLAGQLYRDRQFDRLGLKVANIGVWREEEPVHPPGAPRVQVINDTLAAMLGYTVAELTPFTQERLYSLVHPGDIRRLVEARQAQAAASREAGGMTPLDFRMLHKQGHWVWVLHMADVYERDDEGRPTTLGGVYLDITARKQQESQLAQALARMARTNETFGIGFWEFDRRHKQLHTDTISQQVLGLAPAQLPQQEAWQGLGQRLTPESRQRFERAVRACMAEGTSYDMELGTADADGQPGWVRVAGVASVDGPESRAGARVHGLVQDITAHKTLQVDLDVMRDNVELIGRVARVGYWQMDLSQGTVTYSSAARQLLGMQDWAEVLPLTDTLPLVASTEDRDALTRGLNLAQQDGRPFDETVRLRTPDGRELWVRVVGMPRSGRGPTSHVLGCVQDVTDIVALKEQAEQASLAKSAFLANMSHELRTPLNAVSGFLQLLGGTALSAQQHDLLGNARTASRNLLGLINDVLDFSKIEAGKMELAWAPVRLSSLVHDLHVVLQGAQTRSEVALRVTLDPALPEGLLLDAQRLTQVLINLGGNALKFTHQGEVAVHLVLAEPTRGVPEAVCRLRVEVVDTGIGMNAEQVSRLFQAFEQTDRSVQRRYGGTGLGLVISQRLVQLMGGELRARSAPGVGSRFEFDISTTVCEAPGEAPFAPPVLADGAKPVLGLAGLRVLVAEDNVLNQMVIGTMLEQAGAEVRVVNDGREAVGALSEDDAGVDVLITDMQMPEMDGTELCRWVRAHPRWANLPVVGMTANAIPEDLATCRAAGMDEVVTKPFEQADLARVISRLI